MEYQKSAVILIIIGVLVLGYAFILYFSESEPPASTFITFATTKPTQATTTTTFPDYLFDTTTTQFIYVTNPTLATQPTYVTTTTTTTTLPLSCFNGVWDIDESEVDCNLKCYGCTSFNLSTGWKRYLKENIWIQLENSDRVSGATCTKGSKTTPWGVSSEMPYPCFQNLYYINIRDSMRQIDVRGVVINDTVHVDAYEFKILADYNDSINVVMRKDIKALEYRPEYWILSVGGHNCNHNQTGFCHRNWNGYTFYLRERATRSARLDVTNPEGKKETVWVTEGETIQVDDISIGLLYYYEKGGYASIYVKQR